MNFPRPISGRYLADVVLDFAKGMDKIKVTSTRITLERVDADSDGRADDLAIRDGSAASNYFGALIDFDGTLTADDFETATVAQLTIL